MSDKTQPEAVYLTTVGDGHVSHEWPGWPVPAGNRGPPPNRAQRRQAARDALRRRKGRRKVRGG